MKSFKTIWKLKSSKVWKILSDFFYFVSHSSIAALPIPQRHLIYEQLFFILLNCYELPNLIWYIQCSRTNSAGLAIQNWPNPWKRVRDVDIRSRVVSAANISCRCDSNQLEIVGSGHHKYRLKVLIMKSTWIKVNVLNLRFLCHAKRKRKKMVLGHLKQVNLTMKTYRALIWSLLHTTEQWIVDSDSPCVLQHALLGWSNFNDILAQLSEGSWNLVIRSSVANHDCILINVRLF